MKLLARILSLFVLAALGLFYMGCDPDDGPKLSEKDKQIEKLNGSWLTTDYKLDGVTPADLNYSEFVLQLTGETGDETMGFSVLKRPLEKPSPWPESGEIEFGTNVQQNLIRKDPQDVDVQMTYEVTETTLVVEFTFSTDPYVPDGRVRNVTGDWHFEFTKQ